MALVSIDGVDLPSPTDYAIPRSDLDSSDSGRNELGVMQRDRIRQGIYKIELEYKGITNSELQKIEAALMPARLGVSFITARGVVTKSMYAGDRKPKMIKYNTDPNKIRWDLSFNLVEI